METDWASTPALAAGDANGDGLVDLLIGATKDDSVSTDAGAVYVFTIVRRVTTYCSSSVNSQGCSPSLSSTGAPSVANAAPFTIAATNVLNNKIGYLFYGLEPQSKPFQGSWRCIAAPTRRTPLQLSGGNPLPDKCSGAYTFDFHARIALGLDPALVVDAGCFAQYWMRDPATPSTVRLSNAIAFRIDP